MTFGSKTSCITGGNHRRFVPFWESQESDLVTIGIRHLAGPFTPRSVCVKSKSRSDFRSPQQIVQAADAIPAIAVGIEE